MVKDREDREADGAGWVKKGIHTEYYVVLVFRRCLGHEHALCLTSVVHRPPFRKANEYPDCRNL